MTALNPAAPMQPARTAAPKSPYANWGRTILIALVIYAGLSYAILAGHDGDIRFRIDIGQFLETTAAVQIHAGAAILALVLGGVMMIAPKGVMWRLHKPLGWTWVVLMAVTAVSSFFITGLFGSWYSPIHGLSAWTLISLPMGVAAIRRRDVARHRKEMAGMYLGGMLLAGLFTMLPGRMMWSVFFGA